MRRVGRQSALGFAAVSLMAGAVACGPRTSAGEAKSPSHRAVAPAESTAPAFDRLHGRWVRTDGGYVLGIRGVSPDGKVDLDYLNPRPIHVEQALATRAGSVLSLFVELRDVNYPGSLYNLAYDPARDLLEGTYYQAVAKETFAVTFERR